MIEPKFQKGDYIINRHANDMAIVKGISKKGYYQFSVYYGGMFEEFKNTEKYNYELQINYQKFWDLCTNEEKKKLDTLIKQKRENI